MSSIQHKRKESLLFREVANIVTEQVDNANISYPTVTGVKLSNDNSHLTVYLTFESNEEKSLIYLNNAKGFVRSQIAKISSLRKVPSVVFKIDPAIKEGKKIEAIIKKMKETE